MRVAVRYERVNFFCYKCGMLGHDFKSCKAEVCKDKDGKRIYGQWVSAVPERDNEFALAKYAKGWAEKTVGSGAPRVRRTGQRRVVAHRRVKRRGMKSGLMIVRVM